MDSEFFTSCLKPNRIFSGFTLKKEQVDEICQKLNEQGRKCQQVIEKSIQLKQQLEEVTIEKERLETLRSEMTELMKNVSNALNEEREQKYIFQSECDHLSENFNALQMDYKMKQSASFKKITETNEKVQQLTDTLEKTVAEHKVQICQQRQDYNRMSEEFASEKVLLKRRNYDLARDLKTAQKLQQDIEDRCRSLESELAASNYEIEKLTHKKAGIEKQLNESEKRCEQFESEIEELKQEKSSLVKEREKHVAEIEDLSNQLKIAKQKELEIIGEFDKYKRRIEEVDILEHL